MATFIYFELVSHHIDYSNKVVMEKLMGNNIVKPHFPYFYFPPAQAKVQHSFVHNLKNELEEVKGVQSKGKLAYKCILLHFVVNKKIVGVRALVKVLNTNPMNISYVVHRRWMTDLTSSSQWAFLTRSKRSNNRDETIVSCVVN
jgi:hypothetical protein